MNKEYKDWFAQRIYKNKKEVENYVNHYKARLEFWESFVELFENGENDRIFDDYEIKSIERIVSRCLDHNNDFGEAIISYRDYQNDGKGFWVEMRKENGRGNFISFKTPFHIEKRTVIDYIECEKQFLEECSLTLANFDKNIKEINDSLEQMKLHSRKISEICEKNKIERCFFEPISFIKEILERDARII